MYNLYREPWLVAQARHACSATSIGLSTAAPARRAGRGDPRRRARRWRRSTARRRPATGSIRSPTSGAPRPDAGDRRLAVPVPADRRRSRRTTWRRSAFILVFALIAVVGAARVTRTPVRRFSPHFFVLGVAFLLLETKSLVTFSLLFGTTWLVNAMAFFAILRERAAGDLRQRCASSRGRRRPCTSRCSRRSRSPTWCRPTPC